MKWTLVQRRYNKKLNSGTGRQRSLSPYTAIYSATPTTRLLRPFGKVLTDENTPENSSATN
jgi:hypothetical protein